MPLLMLKDLPRYECLLEASLQFPDLDPTACEAYLHLLRAGDDVFHVCEANLLSHGLSPSRFTVLMLLLDKTTNQPVAHTPAELAERAGVARATMTGLIDTLERDELVKREADTVDRRMMSVQLTARGQEVLREVLPTHFQCMATLLAPLAESERKTLVQLLNKVVQRAGEMRAGAVPVAVS
jgi:DNA-binding MarR family transcriptional regulator